MSVQQGGGVDRNYQEPTFIVKSLLSVMNTILLSAACQSYLHLMLDWLISFFSLNGCTDSLIDWLIEYRTVAI